MALYQQQSKKTANTSKEVKLFLDQDDNYTLSWLESRWKEMDGARDDSKWELRIEQEDAVTGWNEDGTANVNLPIERSVNRLKEADETAQKPIIKFVPTEEDDVNKVEITEEVFDFVWKEANTNENLAQLRQCKRIFGTGVWKEYIKTDRITKWQLDKLKDGKITGTHKEVKRSWIQGRMVDIRNCWFDPVPNQDDIVDCFEAEVDISKDRLEALKNDPNYKNIEQALKSQPVSEAIRSKVFFTTEETGVQIQKENPKFVIWHYYNKEKGVFIQTVNFDTIIRESVNPCPTGGIPYVILVDEPKYMSLYGRGVNEQLETSKYELNVTTNQLVDLVRESSTNTLLLGDDASIDDNQIVNGIGRVLSIDGENYNWSTPPQSNKGLEGLRNIMQSDATMAIGIDAYSVQGDTARTLGQEEIREVNRLKALAVTVNSYNYFLVRMARLRLAYIQFYLSKTTGKKIIGNKKMRTLPIRNKKIKEVSGVDSEGNTKPNGITFEEKDGFTDFLELTPDKIMSNMDVEVETPVTSTVLKQIKKLRHQEIFEAVARMAQVSPQIAGKLEKYVDEALREQIELTGSDPDKFFEPESEGKEKADIRGKILGDMPLPPKVPQPERNNRDELAQVAGMNLAPEPETA